MVRRATVNELESHLKEFVLVGDNLLATTLMCPHEDCISKAVPDHPVFFSVNTLAWAAPMYSKIKPDVRVNGRPCPYCFRASLVPMELRRLYRLA